MRHSFLTDFSIKATEGVLKKSHPNQCSTPAIVILAISVDIVILVILVDIVISVISVGIVISVILVDIVISAVLVAGPVRSSLHQHL